MGVLHAAYVGSALKNAIKVAAKYCVLQGDTQVWTGDLRVSWVGLASTAARTGNMHVLRTLRGVCCSSVLYAAASAGQVECVQWLLNDAGVDTATLMDRVPNEDETVLHTAARHGHYAVVELLVPAAVRHGTLNTRCHGDTALDVAASPTVRRLLRDAGAVSLGDEFSGFFSRESRLTAKVWAPFHPRVCRRVLLPRDGRRIVCCCRLETPTASCSTRRQPTRCVSPWGTFSA